ncbi:hypothetical protein C0J52_15740 [Blattella germanica]|nr:hypothetical protein C0J52_15740 [Blattella germanica]
MSVNFLFLSHAQVLAALKAWCHWLAQLYTETTMRSLYSQLVLDMVNSSVPLLSKSGEPSKLCHSAAHLLVTLFGTVRPPQMWELEPIRDMYHMAPNLNYLQPEARRLVQLALCNTLLLPSPGMTDQLWDLRHKLLASLLDSLTSDFQRLGRSVTPQAHPIIISTLKLLGDLVEHMQSESSQSKKLLYSVIQGNVHQTLSLFPLYVRSPDICEAILDFFIIAFAGLQQQLGAAFTEQTVQTFLDVFTREHLEDSLRQEEGAGTRVVEKFLQLLQLVMVEPSASFKRFVPSTVSLCLEHVYPHAVFREVLLPQFLTVLLHSLIHKSHALLAEEIAIALFNMAAVNFTAFQSAFLPQFLHSTDGLDDGQRNILQRNFKSDTVSLYNMFIIL